MLSNLEIQGMEEVSRIGEERHQGDRLTFQNDLSFHPLFRQIEAVEQDVDKAERIVAKGKKEYFFHWLTLKRGAGMQCGSRKSILPKGMQGYWTGMLAGNGLTDFSEAKGRGSRWCAVNSILY